MEERRQDQGPQASVADRRYQVQLLDWMAWSEGLQTREAWQRWSAETWSSPPEPQTSQVAPAIPFVPSRLRRRMSKLNKMALFVAHHSLARSALTPDRVIFASQHGELHRTQGLLDAISAQETVSPAHFSLSVHNTSAGLFSIATGCQAPATAIAAGSDTLLFGLLEAIGWLQNHPGDLILFIMADQRLPAAYQALASTKEEMMTFAMAFVLTAAARPSDEIAASAPDSCWLSATNIAPKAQDGASANHAPSPEDTADASDSIDSAGSSLLPQDFLRWLLDPSETTPLLWRSQQHSLWQWSRHGCLS